MIDLIYLAGFIILGLIIVFQILERFHVVDQATQKENKLLEENSRLVKAIIAKNANDYVMTTSIDKVPSEERPKEDNDQIDPDTLSDDDFDKVLGIKRKAPK